MNYENLSDKIIKTILGKGASDAEVFIQSGKTLQIEINKGKIQKLQRASFQGLGIRTFLDGRVSLVSSSDFSEHSITTLIDKALAFVYESDTEEANTLPDVKAEPGEKDLDIYDESIEKTPFREKIDIARELEELAFQENPKIKNTESSSYSDMIKETIICNSRGRTSSWKETKLTLFITPVAEEKEHKQIAAHGLSLRKFGDLPPLETISRKAVDKALLLLGGEKVKSQAVSVVFHPDSGIAVLYGLINGVNGENIFRNQSFLCNKLNKTVASERVTIIDDGRMIKGIGSVPFDDEGVPTSKKIIIDNGKLNSYLYNTYSAKKSKVQTTGNAKRDSYENYPQIGIFNFYMQKGDKSSEQIISEVSEGLYVLDIIGGGPNHITGDFSCGVAGVWIENGRLTKPVAKVTIAGNMGQILSGIDAVGNDLEFNQHIAVPTFRVSRMSVGGL